MIQVQILPQVLCENPLDIGQRRTVWLGGRNEVWSIASAIVSADPLKLPLTVSIFKSSSYKRLRIDSSRYVSSHQNCRLLFYVFSHNLREFSYQVNQQNSYSTQNSKSLENPREVKISPSIRQLQCLIFFLETSRNIALKIIRIQSHSSSNLEFHSVSVKAVNCFHTLEVAVWCEWRN